MASRRRPLGFALLEAVVALAIFAAAGMALYGLFNTNLIALHRAGDVSRQLPAVRHALEHLATVNPYRQGQGELLFDGYEIAWAARPVEPVRQGLTSFGTVSDFDIGLYDIEVEVRQRGRFLGVWRTRQVGYEKVRGLQEPLF